MVHGRIAMAAFAVVVGAARADEPTSDGPRAGVVAVTTQPIVIPSNGVTPARTTVIVASSSGLNQPCPCRQGENARRERPARLWLQANRPILIDDDGYRYEPRIRDIRFAPRPTTLPGEDRGIAGTILSVPSYHQGYFRVPPTR